MSQNSIAAVQDNKIIASKEYECVNEVTLIGAAVGLLVPEAPGVAVLTLATNGGGAISNYPRITWYNENAEKIQQALNISDHPRVRILGEVQTSRKGEGEKAVYYQTIVGKEISYAPRQLEGKLNRDIGNQFVRDVNEAVLVGEIVHTYNIREDPANGVILTLKVSSEHRRNFPKVTLFKRQAEIAKEMKIGEIIAVTGTVQTTRVQKAGNDRPKHVESIVATDIDWYL